VNSDALEGLVVPATLVRPIVLLLERRHEHHLIWKSWF